MAWKARSRDDLFLTPDLKFLISVDYYDDADPANATTSTLVPPSVVLHSKSWVVPMDTTTAQLQAAVVAEGQSARAAVTRLQSAKLAVPVGTIVAVP